jgi:hypothetical protein
LFPDRLFTVQFRWFIDYSTREMRLSTSLKLFLSRWRDIWLYLKLNYYFSLVPWSFTIELANLINKITKMGVGISVGLSDGISLSYKYGFLNYLLLLLFVHFFRL